MDPIESEETCILDGTLLAVLDVRSDDGVSKSRSKANKSMELLDGVTAGDSSGESRSGNISASKPFVFDCVEEDVAVAAVGDTGLSDAKKSSSAAVFALFEDC